MFWDVDIVYKWNLCVCFKGKVNGCHKGISLRTIFRNILWENDKAINSFDIFYISHESCVKNFLI